MSAFVIILAVFLMSTNWH